jgi:type I restriction enzyme R subunit
VSKLLDDLIAQSRTEADAHEDFLRKAEELVRKLSEKQPGAGVPGALLGNVEAATIYDNLDSIPATAFKCPTDDEHRAALALKIDLAVRERAPAG